MPLLILSRLALQSRPAKLSKSTCNTFFKKRASKTSQSLAFLLSKLFLSHLQYLSLESGVYS